MTHASLLHFLVDWIFSLAVALVLKKKVYRPYLGHFKPELAQIWPKVGLASFLDCYSLKKSGSLLKKRSFGNFPRLGGNRNKLGDLAILLLRIAKKNQGQFVATRLT